MSELKIIFFLLLVSAAPGIVRCFYTWFRLAWWLVVDKPKVDRRIAALQAQIYAINQELGAS